MDIVPSRRSFPTSKSHKRRVFREAVLAQVGGQLEVGSLAAVPEEILLRAASSNGWPSSATFRSHEDFVAFLRRIVCEEPSAGEVAREAEARDSERIVQELRATAFADTVGMNTTDRATRFEAQRCLLNEMKRRRDRRNEERAKKAQAPGTVQRPPEFSGEPEMIARPILPATPVVNAVVRERTMKPQPASVEPRLRAQAYADQARLQRGLARLAAEAEYYDRAAQAMRGRGPDDGASRRVGLPGMGGL